ncbi:hypothetical protein GCM10019059_19200 [Camelimonas fluminis]|uniref:Tetratricopeptide repeat protein n=1 Tax=Camelimonas fluminis TaxID=1576911 RepID=A0ABV7UKG3_9HYPH|nr:tetratricopeptide repeat protein [Camelimonas fluminis]GHE59931.1 hypothetical protein GCM10019059_19200 [Camelimonas fluminis]
MTAPKLSRAAISLALALGAAAPATAQRAFEAPSGAQVPVLPQDGVAMPRPSLQPGKPGAPSFTQPAPPPAPVTGERLVNGPQLPNAIDAGLADAGLSEPGQAKAKAQPKLKPPPGADAAYGAYQRGYYATAMKEAEARLKANPRDASAATLLGLLYERGLGAPLDLAKAAHWYAQADKAGSAAATFSLAMMTLQGRGVDKNDAEGKRLLEKAAAAGDASACYNLALVRLSAGSPEADREAVKLLQRAAEAETPEAQYMLATLYRKGRGAAADDIRATQLLRQAAENRLLAAEVEYAIALFNGNGVHKNETGAARLFLKAALDGNAVAQNRIARLLTVGRGVQRNLIEAAGWHLLASSQGLDDAWLDEALKGLTPAERSKAEAFAAKHREPLVGATQ